MTLHGSNFLTEVTVAEGEASRKTLQNIKIRCLETSRININDLKIYFLMFWNFFLTFFMILDNPPTSFNIHPFGEAVGSPDELRQSLMKSSLFFLKFFLERYGRLLTFPYTQQSFPSESETF